MNGIDHIVILNDSNSQISLNTSFYTTLDCGLEYMKRRTGRFFSSSENIYAVVCDESDVSSSKTERIFETKGHKFYQTYNIKIKDTFLLYQY